MDKFEERIKSYWAHTPAIVVVKEIKRRSELPKWEDCPKDHIYVGVSRGTQKDKVTVVKHQIEGIFGLNCRAEKLNDGDLRSIGATPYYSNIFCSQCGEFSTRLDIGRVCNDCTEKNKAGAI